MADKTRSGSSSRRAAGSSGRPPRGGTPTPGAPDPIEESTIPAAAPRTTEAAATPEAAVTPGPSGASTSPIPASVTAPSATQVPVAGATPGTSVGTGIIPAPTTISLTPLQLGDIIKAAVTQSIF